MPGCYGGSPNSYFSGAGGFVTVGPQPLETVMDYLPVFVDLKNAPCLIVGAGSVAARKAGLLLRAGARVTLVAPDAGKVRVFGRDPRLASGENYASLGVLPEQNGFYD